MIGILSILGKNLRTGNPRKRKISIRAVIAVRAPVSSDTAGYQIQYGGQKPSLTPYDTVNLSVDKTETRLARVLSEHTFSFRA